ncbi:hypothetical protein M3610_26160 [Neobacillus sp. MER 74]|uniref:hypothetical protein n=1 Tax=Neobacillus sp. MER 74 TaxID=2939566 RepID=UPI00203C8860|nr:hypothetical protein [Neobacillus sp. MER 74]MCM3118674.1 hypothetical protein [Neobacillus sp. MER 74]
MLYTDESLKKLRMEGDSVLDRIIAELFKNSQVGSLAMTDYEYTPFSSQLNCGRFGGLRKLGELHESIQ